MPTHQHIDDRSLALHRLVADRVRREPARFDLARATLRRWRAIVSASSQPYLEEWERIFGQGMEASLAAAVEDSPRAAGLRQCSPLSCVLTNQERFAFLKDWSRAREAPGA